MSLTKRLLKHPVIQHITSAFFAFYIRLVYATSRKTTLIDPLALPYMQGVENGIFAFWHGRMMLLPVFCPSGRPMRVLISLHRDGRLISRVIGFFGQSTVSGSTSKGGKEAVVEMLRALEAGGNISITPDGPRGPAYVVAKGTISVARLAQKPILPVTFASTRAKHFRSWDKFLLALPFGHIIFCAGAPIMVDKEATDDEQETMRLYVEHMMNQLLATADKAAHG